MMNMQLNIEQVQTTVLWTVCITVFMCGILGLMLLATRLDEANMRKEAAQLELIIKQNDVDASRYRKEAEKMKRDFWEKP